jgi:DNA-binding NarL/FixJ family response regulator
LEPSPPPREEVLTARRREVLQLIAEGKSSKEIAAALNISTRTVEFHRNALMERLGLRTTAELTRWTIEHP